jgi:hypothetical protein
MEDQREEMQQGMSMMQQMQHGGPAMGGAGTGMSAQTGKPADPAAHMHMMEKRMDMMQTMMQTMLDQQGVPPPAMVPAPTK